MYLYLLTNTVNEKKYVGITTQAVPTRWRDHLAKARGAGRTAIAHAIRKYGKEAFIITILGEAASWEDLCTMEREAIEKYQTFGHLGYNMTRGGDGTLGFAHSEATKQLISTKNTGLPRTQEFRDAVGARMRGVPKPAEQRQKMSEWQRGENNNQYGKGMSEEHKAKLLAVNLGHHRGKGVPVSEERRAKLQAQAAARRGVPHTPEALEKIAASRRGKTRDEATKAKVSEGMKAYHATHANPMQGRSHSAETRAKQSARARDRFPAIMLDGVVYASMIEASAATGLSRHQIQYRIKHGAAFYVEKE